MTSKSTKVSTPVRKGCITQVILGNATLENLLDMVMYKTYCVTRKEYDVKLSPTYSTLLGKLRDLCKNTIRSIENAHKIIERSKNKIRDCEGKWCTDHVVHEHRKQRLDSVIFYELLNKIVYITYELNRRYDIYLNYEGWVYFRDRLRDHHQHQVRVRAEEKKKKEQASRKKVITFLDKIKSSKPVEPVEPQRYTPGKRSRSNDNDTMSDKRSPKRLKTEHTSETKIDTQTDDNEMSILSHAPTVILGFVEQTVTFSALSLLSEQYKDEEHPVKRADAVAVPMFSRGVTLLKKPHKSGIPIGVLNGTQAS